MLGYNYALQVYLWRFFILKERDYEEVEQLIGYEFKNRLLLQQAFTRKTYTQETHDGENNEVLEFIGDKVLDFIVVKALTEYYGEVEDDSEFSSEVTEGKLTEIKKHLVECKMLAKRIDALGFSKYLIMGKGDRQNNVQEDEHVKEDLFEAIIGAVAVDSGWDMDAMQDAVEMMLDLDFYLEHGITDAKNFVTLVQEWCQKENGELPGYRFTDVQTFQINHMLNSRGFYDRNPKISYGGYDGGDIVCELFIDDGEPFVGFGYSKSQARAEAAELCYHYLEDNDMLFGMIDEVGEPLLERAINQLQELAQKGYFSLPVYEFEEEHDGSGNPVWTCVCSIAEYKDSYYYRSSSKKEAKRHAAYEMLLSIVGGSDDDDDDDDWD